MESQRSVHYVATDTVGTSQVTYIGDITDSAGIQRVAFTFGRRSGQLTEVVSNHHAWIRGDAFALARFLAFPASSAEKYAGRWLNVPSSDYASVSDDVTLGSAVETLKLHGPITAVGARRLDGRVVSGLRGSSSSGGPTREMVLYARAKGLPLPVVESGRGQDSTNVVFSRWNETVRVTVPEHAVTLGPHALPSGPAVPA